MLKEDPLGEPLSGREKGKRRRRGKERERRTEGQKVKSEGGERGSKRGSRGAGERRGKGRAGKDDGEEGRAAAVKLHFILTDLLYTLISLLKKRKWHSIRRNPFLPEQACQPGDEWIQAELSSSGLAPSGTQQQQQPLTAPALYL